MTYNEYIEITKQYSTIFHFDANLYLNESDKSNYLLTGYFCSAACAAVYNVYKHQLYFHEYEFRTGYECVYCYTQKEFNDAIKEQIIRMKKMKLEDKIKSIEDDFDT